MKDLQKNISFVIPCPFLFSFGTDGNKIPYKALLQNKDKDKRSPIVDATITPLLYEYDESELDNDTTMVMFKFDTHAIDVFDDKEKVGLYIFTESTSEETGETERNDVWWSDNVYRVCDNLIETTEQ